MFAFELTPRHAKNLASQPDAMGALIRTRAAEAADADDDHAITLTNLIIDNADRQVVTEPVTGHVEYQSAQPMLDGVVVRMMFDLPGGSTVSHFDHPIGPLPGNGVIRFKLTSLMNAKYKATGELPHTLPVFISLCRPEAMGAVPHVAVHRE